MTMWYGEKYGRKVTILTGTALMTIGGIMQIAAFGVPQMIVGRVISGIGNGLNTATAPIWQSETSKANMRGKLVVIEMVCNIAGFSLSNWVTYGFSFLEGSVSWRFPLALQLLFLGILVATVPWLPESPRWLMKHGHVEEAEQIIADLESATVDDPYVVTQSKEIQWVNQVEIQDAMSFKDVFTGKAKNKTLRRLLLGMGAQAMQQFGGTHQIHQVLSHFKNANNLYSRHQRSIILLSHGAPKFRQFV